MTATSPPPTELVERFEQSVEAFGAVGEVAFAQAFARGRVGHVIVALARPVYSHVEIDLREVAFIVFHSVSFPLRL